MTDYSAIGGHGIDLIIHEMRELLARLEAGRADVGREAAAAREAAPPPPAGGAAHASSLDRELAATARAMLARRCRRDRIIGAPELFGEPALDILLDLYLKAIDAADATLPNAIGATSAPPTTARRYVAQFERRGWLKTVGTETGDHHLSLTEEGLCLIRTIVANG